MAINDADELGKFRAAWSIFALISD